MEYLKFSNLGQWSLHKSDDDTPPNSDYQPGSKKRKTYHDKKGELHEDFGRKGLLHVGRGSGQVSAAVNMRTAGQVPTEVESEYNDRNPGVGD